MRHAFTVTFLGAAVPPLTIVGRTSAQSLTQKRVASRRIA